MKPLAFLFLVLLISPIGAAPAPSTTPFDKAAVADKLDEANKGLREVEAEIVAELAKIDELKKKIAELDALGKTAGQQIADLQALVEQHAARVKQLGDRYTKVLELAQRLKKDLEGSVTLNYVLGGTAVVAILAAVFEGIALAGR